MPVKVLFVNAYAEFAGPDTSLLNIVKYLDKSLFKSYVIFPRQGGIVDSIKKLGIPVQFISTAPVQRFFRIIDIASYPFEVFHSTLILVKFIRKNKIDLVYANSSVLISPGLAALICRKKIIYHFREIWALRSVLIRGLYKMIYQTADRILAISSAVALGNFKKDPKNKIIKLYDAIDLSLFQLRENRSKGKVNITCIGRLLPIKGQDLLLESAIQILDEGNHQIKLRLVGDTPRPYYRPYKKSLLKRILESGHTEVISIGKGDTNIPEILQQTDILVLPTRIPEGLGIVILEAWASKVCVVAPDAGGPAEIVTHNHDGLLFEPGNMDSLTQALRQLLISESLRDRLAENGYSTVTRRHDIAKTIIDIQNILLNVVGD